MATLLQVNGGGAQKALPIDSFQSTMWTETKFRGLFAAEETTAPSVAPLIPRTVRAPKAGRENLGTTVLLSTALILSLWFLNAYVTRYLTVDAGTYGIFWSRHEWLIAHIAAGTAALLIGPMQLWIGLSRRYPSLHRAIGYIYVVAVASSSVAACQLASNTDFGWIFSLGFGSMAVTWVMTTGLAVVAIVKGLVDQHREWMVRSYVVTFGFVTFRLSTEILGFAGIGSYPDQLTVASWLCWSIPLFITETLIQGRKIFAASGRSTSPQTTNEV